VTRTIAALLLSLMLALTLADVAYAAGCVPNRSALSTQTYMRATQNAQSGVNYWEFKTYMGAYVPYVQAGSTSYFLISLEDHYHVGSHAAGQFGLVAYPDGTVKIYARVISASGADLYNGTIQLLPNALPEWFYIDISGTNAPTWNLFTGQGQTVSVVDYGHSVTLTRSWMEVETYNQRSQAWGERSDLGYMQYGADTTYTSNYGTAAWFVGGPSAWPVTPSSHTWMELTSWSGDGSYTFGDADAICH
jgi:hypothetical protein